MSEINDFIEKIGKNRFRQTEQAKLYIEIDKLDQLVAIVSEAKNHKIPYYIIGAGSWPRMPKVQLDGLLIKNNCRRFEIFAMSGKMNETQMGINYKLVYAESGAILNQVVRFTIEEGLAGLEYQLGLPGTVGGAIYTNARYTPKSIYVNDSLDRIKIINKKGEIEELSVDYLIFPDTNILNPSDIIILSAIFRLTPGDKNQLWERANEAALYRSQLHEKLKL